MGIEFCATPPSNVGAGLPAMAVQLPPTRVTEPPLSRASPLPQGISGRQGVLHTLQNKGGSWLACDGGATATNQSD
ncbi:hypothetical protein FIV38_27225 [Pseudomonas proteolytica]|nr:hypothetical protein F4W61_26830 [Pseudomonas proteolytica]TWR73727.1 hypothetical protein FIV38_27225 [Pseudomonas proteolytica]